MSAEHMPAEVFPPGEFIKDEIEERGWTQEYLAELLGKSGATRERDYHGRALHHPRDGPGAEQRIRHQRSVLDEHGVHVPVIASSHE